MRIDCPDWFCAYWPCVSAIYQDDSHNPKWKCTLDCEICYKRRCSDCSLYITCYLEE